MSGIDTSASYLYTAVLSADDAASLDEATDAWLNDHIANEVVSMQLAPGGDRLYLLIIYKGERRVRRA
ncbi:MAG: hypothetical protein OXS47_03585 [Chloroflexota bacterium]|nr:hypothetical protein [Chloroflexota bacterium]MDE2668924.1 hypothetical protein [Chloroflexota bacterium]MDE2932937.1 hypothetical protein [Chloroflexota bacterium]